MNVKYMKASGSDIARIATNIEETVADERIDHVILACLVIATLVQDPNMNSENLQACVKSASEHIALHISTLHNPGVTH